tara:strand:+ start:2949 stop:4169 length:1221 start_codon:yes stop_codon:yes gene_type:complete
MEKKIKNIAIIWENVKYGGMNTFIENLINSKELKNIKINLITNKNNEGIQSLKNNIKNKNYKLITYNSFNVVNVNNYLIKLIFWTFRPLFLIASIIQTYLILKNNKPEIILATCGGYGNFRTDSTSLISAKFLNIKGRILNIHHSYTAPRMWNFFLKYIDKRIRNSSTNLIFNSKAVKLSVQNNTMLLNTGKKFDIIHLGVSIYRSNQNRINLNRIFKTKKKNTLKIGILSRVETGKGHYDMIEAFSRLSENMKKNFQVFFVGPLDANELKKINKNLKKLNLNKFFKVTGFLNCDSLHIIKKLDLVLSLSTSFEGFGLSIAEALMAKKPIVATKVGAVTEFLNNKNSKLINPGNINQIKSSLEDFYKNKKKWKGKALIGHKTIIKKFTSEITAKKYIENFKIIIDR